MYGRCLAILMCVSGWLVLAGGVGLPLLGIGLSLTDATMIGVEEVAPAPMLLLIGRSIGLGLIASIVAVMFGVLPGIWLGERRGRLRAIWFGLLLAPLFVPPQVYAYAWDLLGGAIAASQVGKWMCVCRAGLISGSWLWPIAALIVADGWRTTGRPVSALASLDSSPIRATLLAGLPATLPHLGASAAAVFAVSVLEYSIPSLSYARVHATELSLLVNQGAPPGDIVGLGAGALVLVMLPVVGTGLVLYRTAQWQDVSGEVHSQEQAGRVGLPAGVAAVVVLGGTVVAPIGLMVRQLRSNVWWQGFDLFGSQWIASLEVAALAGVFSIVLAVAVVLYPKARRGRWVRWLAAPSVLSAIMPPALLAIGSVIVWNGWIDGCGASWVEGSLPWAEPYYRRFVEGVYSKGPVVMSLSLVGRYGAIGLLAVWLTTSRWSEVIVEQARCDGAGVWSVVGHIMLPMYGWVLVGAGVIVSLLAMGDVVLTDDVLAPVGYNMLSPTLVGYMHYGRDDVVITTSLFMVGGGVMLAQACGWILWRTKAGRG